MDARQFARAHDAYLDPDRYFDDETQLPRCSCGAFLKEQPDRTEPFEDGFDCDGSEVVRDEPYDESIIAILGEEYRNQTYRTSTSPCGIEIGPHEPHCEILNAGTILFRVCARCGAENKEAS